MEITLNDLNELENCGKLPQSQFKIVEQPVFSVLTKLARKALLHKQTPQSLSEGRLEVNVTLNDLEDVVLALRLLHKKPVDHNPWITVSECRPLGGRIIFTYSQENNEYCETFGIGFDIIKQN